MSRIFFSAVCFLAIVSLVAVKGHCDEHKYVGVKSCKMCHSSESRGNQYKHWLDSQHAKAYETLGTDAAKKTAAKVGVTTDPQKTDKCLMCHVTAFGEAGNLKEASFNPADGVQCESCHGPGSDYKNLSVMQDKQKAQAAGLITPTKETCVKCHNEESPNYVKFNYEEFYKKIAHPRPKQ